MEFRNKVKLVNSISNYFWTGDEGDNLVIHVDFIKLMVFCKELKLDIEDDIPAVLHDNYATIPKFNHILRNVVGLNDEQIKEMFPDIA